MTNAYFESISDDEIQIGQVFLEYRDIDASLVSSSFGSQVSDTLDGKMAPKPIDTLRSSRRTIWLELSPPNVKFDDLTRSKSDHKPWRRA